MWICFQEFQESLFVLIAKTFSGYAAVLDDRGEIEGEWIPDDIAIIYSKLKRRLKDTSYRMNRAIAFSLIFLKADKP